MNPFSGENPPVASSSRSHSCRGVSGHDVQCRDSSRSWSARSSSTRRFTSVPPCGAIRPRPRAECELNSHLRQAIRNADAGTPASRDAVRGSRGQVQRINTFLTRLQVSCSHRRFVVARMGSTGSTWLAQLLHSHPDVFCSHEFVVAQVYPAREYGVPDVERLIEHLATDCMHGAYSAAGDVGSVWSGYAIALSGRFTTGLLIRHPARIVNRRLSTGALHFTTIDPEARTSVQKLWGIPMASIEPLNQAFIHDLHTFACQVRRLDRFDCVMRVEDLRDAERCHEAVQALTGMEYEERLVSRALAGRVNVGPVSRSVPEIVDCFTPDQRGWYERILGNVLPRFGYDLYSDELSTLAFPGADSLR